MKKILLYLSLFCISSTTFTNRVNAQFEFSFPTPLQISTNYIQNTGISDIVVSEIRSKEGYSQDDDRQVRSVRPPSELSPQALYKSLAFTPNIQRRRTTLTTIATELEAGNPGRGAELKTLLLGDGSGDIIQQITTAVAPYGVSTNNLADAYAAYWISAWEASRGMLDVPPNLEQIAAVKNLAAKALSGVPQVANATNADKQAFAEVLWVQTVMIDSAAQGVAGNPSTMPQFKAAVRAQAKSLGVDLDSFILTPEGFSLAK